MNILMMINLKVVTVMTLVCPIDKRSGMAELKKKIIWNLLTFFRLGVVREKERGREKRRKRKRERENH